MADKCNANWCIAVHANAPRGQPTKRLRANDGKSDLVCLSGLSIYLSICLSVNEYTTTKLTTKEVCRASAKPRKELLRTDHRSLRGFVEQLLHPGANVVEQLDGVAKRLQPKDQSKHLPAAK